jgi:hypothetical protein
MKVVSDAPAEEAYLALATQGGLCGRSIPSTTNEVEEAFILALTTAPVFRMKVEEFVPSKRVVWCWRELSYRSRTMWKVAPKTALMGSSAGGNSRVTANIDKTYTNRLGGHHD